VGDNPLMSANLDLVRSIYASWERGDWSSAGWAHSQIEFDIADGPEPGIRIGIAAMAESWQEWLSAWEDYRIEAEEYRELDQECVLVLNRYGGRGRTSGLEIGEAGGTRAATIFYVRDGKVIRLVGYNNRDRALVDLGLAG
jgi:ketosteroid isomerase-like protein